MFLHRAGHGPEDNKMQEVGQIDRPNGGEGQKDFERASACGQEAHPGGVNVVDTIRAP